MLTVKTCTASYGAIAALHGISLEVSRGRARRAARLERGGEVDHAEVDLRGGAARRTAR